MRLLLGAFMALATLLGLCGRATADASPAVANLAIDEPKSGIHLDLEGGCQVRPADGGGAACRDFAASADKSEAFAVVLGTDGLLFYSVAIFAEREVGSGEARARRISATMGESVAGPPTEVTYGDQRLLRTQLRTAAGAAICFITIDDTPEIAIVMFATEPGSLAAMEPQAAAAMRTLRRTRLAAPPPVPVMGRSSQVLLSAVLIAVFGLPVFGFIGRSIVTARRLQRSKRRDEKPPRRD